MDISEICKYIVDNINCDINVKQISDIFHYNKSYLMRKFKENTGFTINEFLNECRVYNSTDPLIYTNNSILKIALTNGYNSLEYYSEKFKDIIGTSPLKFRQIYSTMLKLIQTTNDPKKLKYIKIALQEIKRYQEYLNSISDTIKQNENHIITKPKIKNLKISYLKKE